MIAMTRATPTTTPARVSTLALGAFIVQLRSGSPERSWTKARNCAVLRLGSVRLSGITATVTARARPGSRIMIFPVAAGVARSAVGERAGEAHVGPVYQPRQHDDAAGAQDDGLRADPLDHLLEVLHVGRPDVDQGVGLAGDRAGLHHLGMPAHRRADLRRRGASPAEQLDVRLGGPAEHRRVHPGG